MSVERPRVAMMIVDTLPPVGTIQIEGGAPVTTSLLVTLDLSATDAGTGVSAMRFSNDGVTWAPMRSGDSDSFYGTWTAPEGDMFIVGENGQIRRLEWDVQEK